MFQPTPEQRALIQSLPHSERDLLSAARALEYRGDERAAAALLGLAVQQQPSEALRTAHGNLLFRLGEFQKALITLIPILRTSPHHQQTLILVCECLIEVGEYQRAQTLIGQARTAGVAPPVVANLQNLLTTRRMGLNARSDASLDSTSEQSLLAENFLPMADAASTYQEPINDATEAINIDTGILGNYTEVQGGNTAHANHIPTAASSAPNDYPTLAASADLYRQHKPLPSSDEEPTKSFTRSEALSRVQQHANRQLQQHAGHEDRTYNIEHDVTFDASAHSQSTRTLGNEESAGILDHFQGSGPTRSVPHDAIPFGNRGPNTASPGGPPPQPQRPEPQQRAPQQQPPAHTQQPVRDDPAGRSASMLGNPEFAARFAMPDMSAEVEQSDLRVGMFGSPSDLFDLAGEDGPSSLPPSPSFQPAQDFHVPEASDAPSFGARPAMGPNPSRPVAGPATRGPAQNRAFSEDSLQLDLEQNQLDEISTASQHQAPRKRTTSPSPALETQASAPKKERKNGKAAKVILGVMFILVVSVGTIAGMLYAADHSLKKQIDERTMAALTNIRLDDFQGRRAGYKQLGDALSRSSFLGSGIDDLLGSQLGFLPGVQGSKRKHRLFGDLAILSASLEYHDGKPGDFEAAKHLERAKEVLGAEHPQVLAARAYLNMSEDPLGALELARRASSAKGGDFDYQLPVIDALLATKQNSGAWEASLAMRESATLTLRQQKYVGFAALAAGEDAISPLKAALEMTEDEPLDIQMAFAKIPSLADAESTKAIRALEKARTNEADYPACLRAKISMVLSSHHAASQDIKTARTMLTEAVALCPERVEPQLALIDFMLSTGQSSTAQSRITKLAKTSKSPFIPILQAKLELLSGEPRAALETLAPVDDALPLKKMMQGDASLQIQDYTRAQKYYDAVAKVEDARGSARAHSFLSRVLAAPAHIDSIDEEMSNLIEAHPNSTDVLHIGALIKAIAAQQQESNKKRKDLEAQSDKRFSQALSAADFDAPILFDRCRVFARRGELERAYRSCQDAHQLVKDNVPGEVTRADVMAQMGKHEEAISAMMSLDKLTERENITVRVALARTYIHSDRAEKAQKVVDALKQQAPDDPRVILLLGLHAFHSERYVQAYSLLKRAKALAPTNTEAVVFLAYAQVRVNKLEEASEPLKKHLSDPVWGGYAWLALGELRRRQERFKDAEENLEVASKLLIKNNAPTWFITEAYLQRALAWIDKNGWQDKNANDFLQQAARKGNENHAGLNYVRGIHALYQRRAEPERALEFFDLALATQPDHCPTLKTMPETLERLGKDERAKEIKDLHQQKCKD